jgi:hypothetical protein
MPPKRIFAGLSKFIPLRVQGFHLALCGVNTDELVGGSKLP